MTEADIVDTARRRRRWRARGAAAMAAGLILVPLAPAGAAEPFTVVAEGLDNPRGIAVDAMGRVFVAEAGAGGDTCVSAPDPEGGPDFVACLGPTGSVTRVVPGDAPVEVVGGLPSLAEEGGFAAIGVHDVTATSGLHYLLGNATDVPPELMPEEFGKLFRATRSGSVLVADVEAFEVANNPHPASVDSNPYGLYTMSNGRHALTDAAGNDIFLVSEGSLDLVTVLPDGMAEAPPFLGLPPGTQIPYQPVPTAITRGPDGAFYVGQLTGFPFPVGGANVYRVTDDGSVEVYASGFTNIIDVTFGPDGSLYVLELNSGGLLQEDITGALHRIAPDGSQTQLSGPELQAPGGVAVGHDGTIYVTNFSIFPGMGQVLAY